MRPEPVRDTGDREPGVPGVRAAPVIMERHEPARVDQQQREPQVAGDGFLAVMPVEERAVHPDTLVVQPGYLVLEPPPADTHPVSDPVLGEIGGEDLPRVPAAGVFVTLMPVHGVHQLSDRCQHDRGEPVVGAHFQDGLPGGQPRQLGGLIAGHGGRDVRGEHRHPLDQFSVPRHCGSSASNG